MTTPDSAIPVVTTKTPANYPFSVQLKNTENWGTHDATVTLEAAQEVAKALLAMYPGLPVRIEHNNGGLQQVQFVPKFKRLERKNERPYRTALWSGVGDPPELGARVEIGVNGIGPGTVEGYAVSDGYLGLMVRADEATRPDWHRAQNPANGAFLTFGAELKCTLADLYALWDKLADVPVAENSRIEEAFHCFDAGTPVHDVWRWFEKKHRSFIVGDVQQGIRVKD